MAKTKKPKDMGPMAQNEMMDKLYNRLKDLYDARMQAKAELESAENDMLWAQAGRRSALRDTIIPEPSVIPDILEKERENLKPSILERLRHMRHRSAGEERARQFDQHIKDNYGFVNNPALSERIERLTERVRALSAYPDEPSHVRIIGRPRDPDKVSGLENGAWSTSDTIYFGIDYLEEGASDDEIMFVAGHEIAHVQRGHYTQYIAAREDVSDTADPGKLIDWENSPLSEEQKLKIHEAVYRGALHDLGLLPKC
ncbi:MAG: M48 family metalloprotease [Phycisphaerae bacterium]